MSIRLRQVCAFLLLCTPFLSPAMAGVPGQFTVPSRPAEHVSFPEIKDWNSLTITLVRGRCLGACPAYIVEIHGDGTVLYTGNAFVAMTGRQQAKIPQAAVRRLFEKFRAADFFWSFDRYQARVTDLPTARTKIEFDDRQKELIDYGGRMVGMPQEFTDLELAIDEAAGTARWIKPQPR